MGATSFDVDIGFQPAAHAIDDPDHPGLLRAGERAGAPYAADDVEYHSCNATDLVDPEVERPDLFASGFDTVDLTPFDTLQATFRQVRAAGRIDDDDASVIRASLDGATLHTPRGRQLKVLHIADEGLIMRRSGPNGLSVVEARSSGMNDHGVATSVHADQDVYGTPLSQLMEGRAPELFRHDSPDGHNDDAELMLANFWIPLHQITQPLALAHGRSVDRRRHQLRYGLATTSFLERDDDMAINDIWTFLHDPAQEWFIHSEMDHRQAYVFNTLSTPHGSCTLPGEHVAERCYQGLEQAEAAATSGDVAGLEVALAAVMGYLPPADTPAALRSAIDEMVSVANAGSATPVALCDNDASEWLAASRARRNRVVRSSIELRMVVSVTTP